MGKFAVASAYAGMAAVGLEFGVGRQLLVEVSRTGPSRAVLLAILKWRGPIAAALFVGALIAATSAPSYLGVFLICATRIAVGDLEVLLIAEEKIRPVVVATMANALVTAGATLMAAPHGHEWLLYASGLGNAIAAIVLGSAVVGVGLSASTTPSSRLLPVRQVWPFAAMALIGLIYLRSGIAVLKPLGVPDSAIASFAISSRLFDTIVAMRGGLVQRAAVQLSSSSAAYNLVDAISSRIYVLSVAAAVAGVSASLVAAKLDFLDQYPDLWPMLAVTAASTPLIMSHSLTSAWLFSQPGRLSQCLDQHSSRRDGVDSCYLGRALIHYRCHGHHLRDGICVLPGVREEF